MVVIEVADRLRTCSVMFDDVDKQEVKIIS